MNVSLVDVSTYSAGAADRRRYYAHFADSAPARQRDVPRVLSISPPLADDQTAIDMVDGPPQDLSNATVTTPSRTSTCLITHTQHRTCRFYAEAADGASLV